MRAMKMTNAISSSKAAPKQALAILDPRMLSLRDRISMLVGIARTSLTNLNRKKNHNVKDGVEIEVIRRVRSAVNAG